LTDDTKRLRFNESTGKYEEVKVDFKGPLKRGASKVKTVVLNAPKSAASSLGKTVGEYADQRRRERMDAQRIKELDTRATRTRAAAAHEAYLGGLQEGAVQRAHDVGVQRGSAPPSAIQQRPSGGYSLGNYSFFGELDNLRGQSQAPRSVAAPVQSGRLRNSKGKFVKVSHVTVATPVARRPQTVSSLGMIGGGEEELLEISDSFLS
jgi:hypothetical protein